MLKAVFFDMDGTITEPNLDFKALRRSVGVPDGMSIMGHIESLSVEERQRAEAVLEEAEYDATVQAGLNPGASMVLSGLRQLGIRLVLITNNHRRAMHHVLDRFRLHFDLALSREDGPVKPAPDLLHRALGALSLGPHSVCFVGDGRYDQLASEAAGIRYIHLSHDGAEVDGATIIPSLDALWPAIGLEPPTLRTQPA
jgi:HAD superfamily hydrolase (TIGR01509 family)